MVCEGQQGVSDVFASALWEIDEQLDMAREGVAGDYMHGTVLQCDTGQAAVHVLHAAVRPDRRGRERRAPRRAAGVLRPRRRARRSAPATSCNLSNPAWATVRAYAVKHADGTMTVVLDNVQDPASNGATHAAAGPRRVLRSAQQVNLTASGLTATTGITLGGQTRPGRRHPGRAASDRRQRGRLHADGQRPGRQRRAADLHARAAAGTARRSSAACRASA